MLAPRRQIAASVMVALVIVLATSTKKNPARRSIGKTTETRTRPERVVWRDFGTRVPLPDQSGLVKKWLDPKWLRVDDVDDDVDVDVDVDDGFDDVDMSMLMSLMMMLVMMSLMRAPRSNPPLQGCSGPALCRGFVVSRQNPA